MRHFLRRGPYIVSANNSIDAYRLTNANAGWVEGTNNGPAQTGSSCWNYANYNTKIWASTTPGTAAVDYVGGTIAAAPFSTTPPATPYIELEFNDVSFINSWIAGNNPGLLLRPNSSSPDSLISFHSSEDANPLLRPKLIVDYTPIVAGVPTDNVIGHWQLDEAVGATVAVDASGNGRDGSLLGPITPGQAGAAAYSGTSYNMQDARVHVPADAGTASESFSFSTWVKVDSLPDSGDYMGIVDNRKTTGTTGNYTLTGYAVHCSSNGTLSWVMGDGVTGNGYNVLQADSKLTANTWTHLALTYDADTDTATMYRDGLIVDTDTIGFVPNDVYDFSLGSMSGYGGIDADQTLNHYQLNGNMDDAWLFDTALNSVQVNSLMDNGTPVPEPGSLALLLGIAAGMLLIIRKR